MVDFSECKYKRTGFILVATAKRTSYYDGTLFKK